MVKARKTVVVNFSFISPDRCDKQALCVCHNSAQGGIDTALCSWFIHPLANPMLLSLMSCFPTQADGVIFCCYGGH